MRVALTGGTGFVGSHVLAELEQHGHEVTALVRDDAQAEVVRSRRHCASSEEEARARLGDYFAEVLLLDQIADAAKARAELDWHPSRPGLVEEFRQGSYRKVSAA